MKCDAMIGVSRHRHTRVLAVVTAAALLLSTGGVALGQEGNANEGDALTAEQMLQRMREPERRVRRDAELAERAVQLREQLEQQMAQNREQQLRNGLLQRQVEQLQQALDRAEPLSRNPSLQTVRLIHARAEVVADLLQQVYGDQLRVAVDEPSNTLLVLSEANAAGPIQELISTLDSAPVAAGQEQPVEERTLQLRILWLMDGLPDEVGKEPEERYVSPMVVDVLHGLGLEHPKIVCQHASTLSAQPEGRSKFTFADPVRIYNAPVKFEGRGELSAAEGDRYRLELRIEVEAQGCDTSEMAGSLVMPLEHYVVLGTTNFLGWTNEEDADEQSFPTAFVVFLQEAPIAPR